MSNKLTDNAVDKNHKPNGILSKDFANVRLINMAI